MGLLIDASIIILYFVSAFFSMSTTGSVVSRPDFAIAPAWLTGICA